ncbi:hypothetical protein JCM30760_26570 [Thiomicrorhabdus hydrogeniphila]
MEILHNEDQLKAAYFNKCRQSQRFLMGVKNSQDKSMKSYCLIGFANGTQLQGEIQPINFADPFWWPAIATFTDAVLAGELKRKIESLNCVYDDIIYSSIQ